MLKRSLTIFGNVCNTSCLCFVFLLFVTQLEDSFEEHVALSVIRISGGYFVPVSLRAVA